MERNKSTKNYSWIHSSNKYLLSISVCQDYDQQRWAMGYHCRCFQHTPGRKSLTINLLEPGGEEGVGWEVLKRIAQDGFPSFLVQGRIP